MYLPRTLAYTKTFLRLLARNRSIWACVVAIALFNCSFLLYPITVAGDMLGFFQTQYQNSRSLLLSESPLSSQAEQEINRRTELLHDVVANWETDQRMRCIAEYEAFNAQVERAQYENRTLVGDYSDVLRSEGTAWLYARMTELENTAVYSVSTALPTLNYLLYALSGLPYFTWYIPLLVAVAGCAREREADSLLACAPMNQGTSTFGMFWVLLAFSLTSLFACWLPAAAWTFICNGIGDPRYPIAFVTNDTLVTSTIAIALLKWLAGFTAETALFCLLAAACLTIGISHIGQALTVVVLALPLLPGYLTGSIPEWLLKYLPSTFLEGIRYSGVPGISAYLIESGPGCTLTAGLLTIAACALVLIATFLILFVLMRIARTLKHGGSS